MSRSGGPIPAKGLFAAAAAAAAAAAVAAAVAAVAVAAVAAREPPDGGPPKINPEGGAPDPNANLEGGPQG